MNVSGPQWLLKINLKQNLNLILSDGKVGLKIWNRNAKFLMKQSYSVQLPQLRPKQTNIPFQFDFCNLFEASYWVMIRQESIYSIFFFANFLNHSLPFVYLTLVFIIYTTQCEWPLFTPLTLVHPSPLYLSLSHSHIVPALPPSLSPADFVPLCLSSCQSIRAVKPWCKEQMRERES